MSLAKLRIEPHESGRPILVNLYLNDQEIGSYVRAFKLEMEVGEVPTAEFTIRTAVEIDDLPVELLQSIFEDKVEVTNLGDDKRTFLPTQPENETLPDPPEPSKIR